MPVCVGWATSAHPTLVTRIHSQQEENTVFYKVLLAAALFVAVAAQAESISLEDTGSPEFKPVPAKIRQMLGSGECLAMRPVKLAPSGKYFAAVAPCEGGSGGAPSWLLEQHGNTYRVLLDMGSYNLDILPARHNGLHDVSFSIGNAGGCTVYTYRYNGSVYRKHKSKSCFQG